MLFNKIVYLLLKAADVILTFLVLLIMLIFTAYGFYTSFYNTNISNEALSSGRILNFSPEVTSEETDNENNVSLSDLSHINEDVRGWLVVDGTNINYPILQGNTDFEYLNTDIYGEYSLSGSIFLSCTNSPDFSDNYNLIYGHHMENGAMFGDLDKYFDEGFFDTHNSGRLYIMENGAEQLYNIKFFKLLSTDAYDKYVFDTSNDISVSERVSYFIEDAAGNNDLSQLQSKLTEASDKFPKIISLATCADNRTNGRTVLIGYID